MQHDSSASRTDPAGLSPVLSVRQAMANKESPVQNKLLPIACAEQGRGDDGRRLDGVNKNIADESENIAGVSEIIAGVNITI